MTKVTIDRELLERVVDYYAEGEGDLKCIAQDCREALSAPRQQEGNELERRESGEWKLVPIEPTLEMLDAAKEQADCMGDWYRAMLAAAPSAPKDDPVKTMLLEALEKIAKWEPYDALSYGACEIARSAIDAATAPR